MKRRLLVLALAGLCCSGCANKVWTHSSKSNLAFYQDSARCEAMANSAGGGQMMYGGSSFANGWNQGAAMGAATSRSRIYNNCMKGEGWYLVDAR